MEGKFLTPEQIEQLQNLCEMAASNRTRSGKITINIENNMPRTFELTQVIMDADRNVVGYQTVVYRCVLPEEEIAKGRQNNRLKPNVTDRS